MYVREYILRLSRNVLVVPVIRRPLNTGVVRRQQACVDRNAGANMR